MMAGKKGRLVGGGGRLLEDRPMSRDDKADQGFEHFEQFLKEWSRRDFLRRMGAAAAYTAFTAGIVDFLEACGGGNTPTSQTPVKGGKLIEGTISDISSFAVLNSGDTASSQMIWLLFDGLLSLNAKGDNIPMMASALPTISADQLTFTFKLRPNLKWSDGQPLTADDVVFTYNLIFSADTKDYVSRYRAQLEGFLQSVTATDPQTVVFKFSKILANFVDSNCRFGILPKHVLGNVTPKALNTHDFFINAPTVSIGVFPLIQPDNGQPVVLAGDDNQRPGSRHFAPFSAKIRA